MIELQLIHPPFNSENTPTFEALARDINNPGGLLYTVFWEITPEGDELIQDAWENLEPPDNSPDWYKNPMLKLDYSKICNWNSPHSIRLNGKQLNKDDFKIININEILNKGDN